MHAVTLRQNLHQFQAGENTRNPASDKAFSRIGPRNDPLEGGKNPKSSMAPDTPTSKPSARDRRAYFRVNTVLPISIQAETDTTEGEFIEKSVNISGGGISVTVNVAYRPDDVLSITLILPDQLIFRTYAEVLWLDPLPYHAGTYRLHARFVRMTTQNQELLIRHILGFQRSRLENHYSA